MEPSPWMGLAGNMSENQKLQFPLTKNRKKNHIRNMCYYYIYLYIFFVRENYSFWIPDMFFWGIHPGTGFHVFFFICCLLFPEFSIWTYFDFFSLVFLHEFSFLGGALYGFCWVGVTGAWDFVKIREP